MPNSRLLSLAAGVVQEFPSEDAVYAAAQAGFIAVGIWCTQKTWSRQRTQRENRRWQQPGFVPLIWKYVPGI